MNLIRDKITFVKDAELLESFIKPFREILGMYVRYAETYSKTEVSTFMVVDHKEKDPIVTYQCQILGYIGNIMCFCNNVIPYIKTTMHDRALGQYYNIIRSTCKYFEKLVMDNEIFHVKLDPPPKNVHIVKDGIITENWMYSRA